MQSDGVSLMKNRSQRSQQRNNRIYIDKSHHSIYKMLIDSEKMNNRLIP